MMLENGLVNSFILTYGLQHGFIDGDTANSILEEITDNDENNTSSTQSNSLSQ